MKKNYIAAAACILALAACSKAELGEGVFTPKGEAVTLTVPQTKVALDGDYLEFEGDETITAVASNGSRATLTAQDKNGKFAGVFDEPVADGSTISLYYNESSVNGDGTASFAQNGKPWLQSLGNQFTRTEDRQISILATLAAPQGVKAIAVVTEGTDIESIEFHSKNGTALASFDGKSFSGESFVSEGVLSNKNRSNIFYVPEGMEGGYWIKAVKGGQSMYKSYSSSTAVTTDSKVTVTDFVPASVKLDVQLSGFPTSYSYYVANEEGSGVTAKDVSKANATANDWIGDGKATYTITRAGIPSTLLKFESFKLTVDGEEKTGTEADKTISYDASNGHTTWGQKDIVATVTYTNLATGATETASKTITRHITGLPYIYNDSFNLSGTGRTTKDFRFFVPIDVNSFLTIKGVEIRSTSRISIGSLKVIIGDEDKGEVCDGSSKPYGTVTFQNIELTGKFTNSSSTLTFEKNVWVAGPEVKINQFNLLYK